MVRKAKKYNIDKVLKLVRALKNKRQIHRINIDGDMIKVTSLRLATFKYKGCKCVTCGMKGTYFFKEKSKKQSKFYHFNLYGINREGIEVLMTKDHIQPKSKGGKDKLNNMQTMCAYCNSEKGDTIEESSIPV